MAISTPTGVGIKLYITNPTGRCCTLTEAFGIHDWNHDSPATRLQRDVFTVTNELFWLKIEVVG